MIPTVQFDPSTLSVWTTTQSLPDPVRSEADATLRAAFEDRDVLDTLDRMQIPEERRDKLLWLASCVWHEKRHFFDTCVTNYGAMRYRSAFELAANFAPLLADAVARDGTVWFPLEVYGCPVRRRRLGIDSPAENVVTMARRALLRKRLLYALDAPMGGPDGPDLSLGAEALLEGLAHSAQVHAIEHRLGVEHSLRSQFLFSSELRAEGPYRMIDTVAGVFGCGTRTPAGHYAVNHRLATATFMTALCSPFDSADPDLAYPTRRLARLTDALGPDSGSFEMTDEEAWSVTDVTARRLFGRDALDEIEADIDNMARVVGPDKAPWLEHENLYDAWVDFLALRRRFLEEIRKIGSFAMSTHRFPDLWLGRLTPWWIVATPGGEPSTFSEDVCFGTVLERPAGIEGLVPETVVWGRLVRPGTANDRFSVRDGEAWRQMLERHAPRALLMQNGRRHRLMVPPQLERPLEEMRSWGLKPRFEPLFEFPPERSAEQRSSDAQKLAAWTERGSFVCDVSGKTIDVGDAALLTPWEYRCSGLSEPAPEVLTSVEDLFHHVNRMTDWSDWIVDRSLLEAVPADARASKTGGLARQGSDEPCS